MTESDLTGITGNETAREWLDTIMAGEPAGKALIHLVNISHCDSSIVRDCIVTILESRDAYHSSRMAEIAQRAATRIVNGAYELHRRPEIGNIKQQEIRGVAAIISQEGKK